MVPKQSRHDAGGGAGDSIDAVLAGLAEARVSPRGGHHPAAPGAAEAAALPGSKARTLPIGTVIIERRRRRESSIEETLLEIYHSGLSVYQAEKIAGTLWGSRLGVSTVSALSRRIARRIEAWRNRAIHGRHSYVFLTGVELRRNWGCGGRSVGVLAAVGVNGRGEREVLGVVAADREDPAAWLEFLRSLQQRGLNGVRLFVGDQSPGLAPGVIALFPGSAYQQCVLQFYRSVLSLVPPAQTPAVEDLLKTIHASADRAAARARAAQVESTMRLMNLPFVAVAIAEYVEQTLNYFAFPRAHWRHLRSNFLLNRIVRDIRERARVVGAFSDAPSAVLLVGARLRHVAGESWGRRHLVMGHLAALPGEGGRAGTAPA